MGFALRSPSQRPIARVGAILPLLLFTTLLLHADAPGWGTGGAGGRCGEDQHRWHPPVIADCPTGHEHGDPPPTWLAASGDTVDFLGPFNTSPAENRAKHAAMKGFAARLHGVDLYVRLHTASNVLDRAARYHSYEVWARDPAGGISHWQGWADSGDPVADRVPQRLPHPKYRPLVRVVDHASYDLGYRCETWYFVTAPWSWDLRWTICGSTTLYYPGENGTPEQAAWRPAPDRTPGTDRRLEATWVATPLLASGTRHTPPVGRFYATQFGEVVAGPDDPRCAASTVRQGVAYPTVCLPQQIAPTMIEVAAPGNTAEHDYRALGLTLPN